jgi:hypothetical protein
VIAAISNFVLRMDWLDQKRVRFYSSIVLAIYIVAMSGVVFYSRDGVDSIGRPLGYDFIAFWSAATLADQGGPADAYDMQLLKDTQESAVPHKASPHAWLYPPTFLLVVLPIAKLPYFWALGAWLVVTLIPLVVLATMLMPVGRLWYLGTFPGFVQNLLQGQNGFLTASLFGGALHVIDRRPWLAGIFFGLLSYKPQFGLLIPLVLLATRRWSTFVSASLTAIAFALLTIPVFGTETWRAFFENSSSAVGLLAEGGVPWEKMSSLYAGLRVLGVPAGMALAVHGIFAAVVAVVTVLAWRGAAAMTFKSAILVLGSVLVSPYCFNYDLVLLALPLWWLGWHGYQHGFRSGEKAALLLTWLTPLIAPTMGVFLDIPTGFVGPSLLFWLLWRRCRAGDGTGLEHATLNR